MKKEILLFILFVIIVVLAFATGWHFGHHSAMHCDGCELGDGFWGVGADAPDEALYDLAIHQVREAQLEVMKAEREAIKLHLHLLDVQDALKDY